MNISWKDIGHYGIALLLMADGAVSALGVALPGVTVSDPKMTFFAGLGILVAGWKGGFTSGVKQ